MQLKKDLNLGQLNGFFHNISEFSEMMITRFFLFFVFFLLCAKHIQSQTADEIIQRHIEAIGGYERIKAIKTITFEGTNKTPERENSFKSYIVHDSAICTEGIADGKISRGIVLKKEGWICDLSKNGFLKKSKSELKREQNALDIHGPLVDYIEKGSKIKYLGSEKIKDMECFKIKLIRKKSNVLIYYFDSSYFVKRIVSLWPTGPKRELTYE